MTLARVGQAAGRVITSPAVSPGAKRGRGLAMSLVIVGSTVLTSVAKAEVIRTPFLNRLRRFGRTVHVPKRTAPFESAQSHETSAHPSSAVQGAGNKLSRPLHK